MTNPSISPEFRVLGHIDSGGQADVYEVEHVRGGRFAARLLRELWDPIARRDFRECTLRQLRAAGPGVVRVFAFDFDCQQPFMIMEFMPQGSLADEIARRAEGFELLEAVAIVTSISEAVAEVHAKGLVHGDVKPGNVLRSQVGAWLLNDFGCAATIHTGQLLRASRWLGTPAYSAPEQLRGTIMRASDVYGLGVVLHELLASSTEITNHSLRSIPELYGQSADALPTLIARLTAAEPSLRPSAREAVALLRSILHELKTEMPLILRPPADIGLQRRVEAPPSIFLRALGTLIVAAAVNRTTKSWDPGIARYRGSDGRFRANGLFR